MPDETNELDFGSQPIMIPKVNRDDETQKLRDMFLRRDESYNEIKEIKRQVQDTNSASNLLGIMKESLRTNQKISTNVSNISTSITSGFNSLKSELQNQYKQQRTQDRIDTDNTKQLISKVDKLNDKIDKIKKQENITGIVIKPINDLIINIKQINKDIEDLKKVYSNPSKSGGYTGGSNINRPQGIVHEGEYVAPQWLVKQERETIRRLEDIRKGYKVGGYVTKNIPSNARIDQELDKLKQRFSDTISKWTVTTQSRPDKQEIGLQLSILQKSMDKNLPTFEFTPQIQKIIKYLTDNNRITAIPQYEEVFKFKDRLDAVLKNEFSKYVEKTNFNKVGSYDPNKFDQLQQNLVDQIKTTEQFKNLPNKLEMTEDELLNFLQLAFSQSDTSSATPGLFINKLRAINKVTGIHFKPLTSIIENVVALAGRPTDYYGWETPNLFKQQKMLMQGKYEDLSKIQTPEVKAYRWGGYTGKGDPNEIQGVVHKDEVVLSSSMWRSLFSSKPLELLKEILHYTERNQVQNELQLKIDKDRFIIEDKKFRDYLSDRNKQKDERAMGTVEEIQEQQQAKQGASGAGQGFLAGILGAKVQSKVGGVFNITKGQGFIGNVKNVLGSTQGRLLGGVGGQVQLGMDQFSQYGQNTQIDPTTGKSATDWGGTVQGTIQGSKQGGLMNQLSQQGKYQQIGTAIGGPLGSLIGGGIGALVGGLGQDRIKQFGEGVVTLFTGIKVTENEIEEQIEILKRDPKYQNISEQNLKKIQKTEAEYKKNPVISTIRKGFSYMFNPFKLQGDILNNQFNIQETIDQKYKEFRSDPKYKDMTDQQVMDIQKQNYRSEHPIISFFSDIQNTVGGFVSGVWDWITGLFSGSKQANDIVTEAVAGVSTKLGDLDLTLNIPNVTKEGNLTITTTRFKSGGFTGNLNPNQIAGVVHGGEYVVPQNLVDKYKPELSAIEKDRLQNLPGYQEGGLVLTPDKPYFYGEIRNMLNAIPTSDNIDLKYTINDALTDIQNQLDDSRFISYENLKSILSFYNLLQTEEPPTSEWYLKEFTKAPEVEHNMLKESIWFFKNRIQENQIKLMKSEGLPDINSDLLNQLTGSITEQSLQPLFNFIDKATDELPKDIINIQQEKIEYKVMTQLQKDSWSNLLTYKPENISNISNLLTYYTGGILSNLENLGANELLPILNSDAFNFMKDADSFVSSNQFKNLNISHEVQAYYIDDLLPDGPVKQVLDSKYLYGHFIANGNKTISLDQFSKYINAQTSDVQFETWKKEKAIDKYATQYQQKGYGEGEGILGQQQAIIDRDYYPITEQYEVAKSDYVPEYLRPFVLSKLGLAKGTDRIVDYKNKEYVAKKTLDDMILEARLDAQSKQTTQFLKKEDIYSISYLPPDIYDKNTGVMALNWANFRQKHYSIDEQYKLVKSDYVPKDFRPLILSKLGLALTSGEAVKYAGVYYIPKKTLANMVINTQLDVQARKQMETEQMGQFKTIEEKGEQKYVSPLLFKGEGILGQDIAKTRQDEQYAQFKKDHYEIPEQYQMLKQTSESDYIPKYLRPQVLSKLGLAVGTDKIVKYGGKNYVSKETLDNMVTESMLDFVQKKKTLEATQLQGLQTKDAYFLSRETLSPVLLNKYDDITNNQFYDIFGNILDKKGLVGYSEAFRVLNNIENFRDYFSELGLDLTPEILQNKNLLSMAYPSFSKILQDPSSMVDISPDIFEHLYLLDLVKDNPQFTKAMLNEKIANKLLDKVISSEPNSLANKSLRKAISDYFDVDKFITLDKLKEMVDEDREERRYIPLIPDSVVDLIHPNSLQLAVQLQKQGGLTYSLLDSQNTVDFQPISGIQGFYTGGFTPDIGTDKIAGVVHGGEYVVPQNLVDRYQPILNTIEKDRLQNLPRYQEGGDVAPSILRRDITSKEFIEDLIQKLSPELSQQIQKKLGIPDFTQDFLNSLVEDLKLSPNSNQLNTLRNIVSMIIKNDTTDQNKTDWDDLTIWMAGQIEGNPQITASPFQGLVRVPEISDILKTYQSRNPQKYWKLDQLKSRYDNDLVQSEFDKTIRSIMSSNLTLDMYYKSQYGNDPFWAPYLGNLSTSFVYDKSGDGIFTKDTDFIRTISLDPNLITEFKTAAKPELEYIYQNEFRRLRDTIFQSPDLLSQLLDTDLNSDISSTKNKQVLAEIINQNGLPSVFISNVTGTHLDTLFGRDKFTITGTPYSKNTITNPKKFNDEFLIRRKYNEMQSIIGTDEGKKLEQEIPSDIPFSQLDLETLLRLESDNYYSSFSKNQMQSELRQLFNEYDKIYPKMYSNKDWTLEQEIVTSWYRDKIQGRNISKYLVGDTIEDDLKYYQEKQIATRERQAQYEDEDPKKYLGEYSKDTLNLIIDKINDKIVSQENIISTLPENQELFTEGQTLNIPGQFNNPDLLHQGLSKYYDKLVKEKKLQYYGGLLNIHDSKYANSPQYQWWMHKLLLSEESVPGAHDALSVRTRDLLTQYLRENFGVQTLSGDYINQLTERPYLNGPNTLQAAFGIYWPDKKLKLDTSNLSNKTITNQNEIQEAVRSGEIPVDRLQELPEEVKMQTIERQNLEIDVFKQLFNPIRGKETEQLVAMLDSYTTPEDANNFLKSLQYIVNHSTIGGNYRISEDYDLPRIQGLLHNEKYGQGYEEYLNTDITLDEIIRQNKDNIITYFKKSNISNKDDMIDYIQKYKVGGYTGEGDQNEIQGFVHKGEYVIPKNIVDSNPLLIDELETMRLRQEDVESLTRNANQSLQDLQEREEPNNPLISNVEVLHRDNQKTVEILTRILEAIANNKPIEIPSEFNVKGIQDLIQTIKNSNTPPINIISPVTNTANSFSNNYGGGLRSQIPMRVPLQ